MKRPLLFAAAGFVLGEVCLTLPVVFAVGIPAFILAGFFVAEMKDKSGRFVLKWILPLFMLFGIARMWADMRAVRITADTLAQFSGRKVRIEG